MDKEALLIIDMSNDFVDDHGSLTAGAPAQAIVPYIVNLAEQFLKHRNPIFFCMDAHEADDPHFQLWPPHNVKGTHGAELYGALHEWYKNHRQSPNVQYIPKPEYDAFVRTDLDERLKAFGVHVVHLTGVCTDICDFLTAYGAYSRGYQTIAHRKGMATFTDQHELFLKHMKAIFQTKIVD
ncbi:cysteine hydrolase [Sporolactobacillus sp. CPB3-1]|uniref:Cysteine hydrolase n=1 Tax=Sporolactobacillus mangiferae TaxID=2940498 RepID=A0ABT0MAJ5_9BACL|nr:isochorismatase family cysteine hydrolase [Sporolactobacillus mangiferae]MCL1631882.1 cysteine hydrolase [Sporolactobacillus mangiferae]